MMGSQVKCVKLGQELEGLDAPPMPGQLGQRIMENVSKLAWQGWLEHQTMLINEHRLSLAKPEARTFLLTELEKYFFSEDAD